MLSGGASLSFPFSCVSKDEIKPGIELPFDMVVKVPAEVPVEHCG